MSGARDTELLNYIRSYGQTEASPPPCKFEHWGITVTLSPKLAKQSEPPADHVVFAEFMEEMLPHCRGIQVDLSRHARRGYAQGDAGVHRSLLDAIQGQSDPELSALRPQRPSPTVWHLVPQMLLQFSKGTLPGGPQDHGQCPYSRPAHAVYPFGPATPPPSSPPTLAKVLPLQPGSPPTVPERPTKKRPLPTGLNPFEQPGKRWDAANFQPAHAEIKLSLNEGAEPADPTERRRAH